MQGKPFFPAGLTAEGRPFILRLRDFHQGSAGLPFSATNGHDCSRRAGGRSGGSRNCSISA